MRSGDCMFRLSHRTVTTYVLAQSELHGCVLLMEYRV